jgi:putative membrane protein
MTVRNGMRGALAGAIGGVAGGAVKLVCEAIVPPRPPDREPPPGVLAAKIARRADGRTLSKMQKQRAATTAHWTFSILSGAVHGALVEAMPSLEKSEGIPFGLAIWIGMHEILLPLTRATPSLRKLPLSEQLNECVTHCVYGVSVERTRRIVRSFL